MNHVWTFALCVALGTACRGRATTYAIVPAPRSPSLATLTQPTESVTPVAPAEATSRDPREGWSPAGVTRYYLREGTFPSREETFRPGLVVEGALEGDVERDGSHVQLVALGVPPDQPRDTGERPDHVLVYLHHTTAGWRSELVPVHGISETYWRRPFVLAGRSVLVAAMHNVTHSERDDADGDGVEEFSPGGVTYYYSLASRAPDGGWFVFETDFELATSEYYERYEFAGLPDGSLLLTSVDGRGRRRWRVLRVDWAERRILTPDHWRSDDAWTRRAPPASVPRPPVARMEGADCRVVMDAPFRLRRTETSAPTGAWYPVHTNAMLLTDTRVEHGDARLYRVRVVTDHGGTGPEGYAFVRGREIWDPCPPP